jgi:hypothetical protein
VDLDDPHHRQRSGCSVGSREVVGALCHYKRAFGRHVEYFDIDLTAYPHELSEDCLDGGASSDWHQRNFVVDGVLAEERPQLDDVSRGLGPYKGGHEVLNGLYGSSHQTPSKGLAQGWP